MNNLEIKETYKNYKPSVDAITIVRTLIHYIPVKYLVGLKHIIITNSSNLSRNRYRSKTWYRKQRVQLIDACGVYHQQWKGASAWIEIFVDNTINMWPRILLKIPLIRDIAFAGVLYHEIGHHIHKTVHPEYVEREDVAEKWSRKLTRAYIKQKYWYLLPIFFLLIILIKIFKTAVKIVKRIPLKSPK